MRKWRRSRGSGVVAALCGLALLLAGLVHRPAVLDQHPDEGLAPALATVLALGGSLDDLCLTGDADDGEHAGHESCLACTLANAATLPCPDLVLVARIAWSTAWPSADTVSLVARHAPRAPPARGPPTLHMT